MTTFESTLGAYLLHTTLRKLVVKELQFLICLFLRVSLSFEKRQFRAFCSLKVQWAMRCCSTAALCSPKAVSLVCP